jgi:hypothetical protein
MMPGAFNIQSSDKDFGDLRYTLVKASLLKAKGDEW